jgi:hypothetical protein
MASIYWVQNCAFQTTAAPAGFATGTAIHTHLQVATPAASTIRIIEWGISLDTPATATVAKCELVDTGAVGATVGTSETPAAYNADGSLSASACVGGTAATCYQPSTEGTITAVRTVDMQLLVPPFVYVKQWPLGREPYLAVSRFLRVRVTTAVTCNAYAYVIWEE